MHELGLCASIVDAIEQRAGERPVARVRIRVGRLHHVHPEAFDQSFAVAAMGSVAEDAAAELVLLPGLCALHVVRGGHRGRRAAVGLRRVLAASTWRSPVATS